MIKLIASDLDGTLLKNNTQILSPEIPELIMKLKKKGIRFIAASGRQYASMRNLFAPVKDEISYITENGSLCIHEGRVLKRGVIHREQGLRIIDDIQRRENCQLLLSCEGTYYVSSRNPEYLHLLQNEIRAEVTYVPDATKVREPFLKIAFYDDKTLSESLDFFAKKYADEIKIVTSGNTWIDFIAPGANKGNGLQVFLDYFSVSPKECMAFGDQQNDIEMLELAGESYAVATAAPGVADHAKYTVSSVADVLKSLL